MSRLATAILVLTVCSSCTVYQYNTLRSDIRGKEKEPFTFENDTLQIRYSFHQGNANIEIFNNSPIPLYIDWSRSSLIMNGDARPYWTNTSTVDLTTTQYRTLIDRPVSYTTGTVTNESPISFIPPNTRILNAPFSLAGRLQPPENSKPVIQQFTPETSPLKFSSYLWLSFDQTFDGAWAMKHTFWLAERRQSAELLPLKSNQHDVYFISELTKGGSIFVGVLALMGIYAWVILDGLSDDNSNP